MRSNVRSADANKVGMLVFLGSEAIFFALLIIAYVFYRGRFTLTGPTPEALNVALGSVLAVLLLSSSATIWFAEKSLQRGDGRRMRLWLLITVALGAVFLIGQGFEFAELFAEGIGISTGLFGTTFFTLTGFHGLHVFAGLVALAIILVLARGTEGTHSSALETASLYWHFVDVVWVVVFSVVYVWSA